MCDASSNRNTRTMEYCVLSNCVKTNYCIVNFSSHRGDGLGSNLGLQLLRAALNTQVLKSPFRCLNTGLPLFIHPIIMNFFLFGFLYLGSLSRPFSDIGRFNYLFTFFTTIFSSEFQITNCQIYIVILKE